MDSHNSVSPWTLEDDYRLIKAIEAGASLESLAKGAVPFSRKFTLTELRDRWYSLLYDPIISSEAASRISELSSVPSHLPEKLSFPPKGNTERVRSVYSAVRKRSRVEPFDPTEDLNYVVGPNDANGIGSSEDPLFGQDILNNDIFSNLNFDESFAEIINNAFPDVLEDIPQDNSMDFLQSGCDNEELGSGLPLNLSFVGNNDFFLDDQMVNHPFQVGEVAEQIENPCPGFGHDQVYVPLLPVSGPVPLVDDQQQSLYLLDIDTEEAIDDKITEASECVMQTVEPEDPTLDIDPYIKELTKSLLDDDEEDPLKGNDSNQQNTAPTTEHVARECQKDAVSGCGVHNNDLSTKHDWNLNPEYCDGVVVCSINRESDEIPENDHVPSEPQNPKARKSSHTSSGEILATKKLGKPSFPPQRAKSRAKNLEINPTNNGSSNRNVECLRMACKSTGFPPSTFHDKVTMMENPAVAINRDEKLEEDPLRDRQTQNAVNDANASAMGPEDDSVESDDDYLPCSISVEAMILDMDLAPAVQDLYESEVAKYQNEDVRRAIIRLEQSARSHMERELVSRGALAILYGENSRYYIKKPEVLLGRATGEYPIDIDLGKSGTITKVSRRQALISLKNDGSFYIKNLGKFPISVNGEEFGYGTVKKLKNDALIEIREMAFIFETSKTCVKRYLESKDNPNNP